MFDIKITLEDFGLDEKTYEELLLDCQRKTNGEIDIDWSEISDKYNLGWSGDAIRKGSQIKLIGGSFVKQYYEEKMAKNSSANEDEYLKKLEEKKREIKKETIKLQTEKLEYNKWLRENARDEMLMDKVIEAIGNLKPMNTPTPLDYGYNNREYLLVAGDFHYGTTVEIKDLFGNVINKYNPEIFELRMNELLSQTIDIIKKENIRILNVAFLADYLQGILRLSGLMQLRYGIVESTIKYSEFICNWLNELSNYVVIKYYQIDDGNHDDLRILDGKKGSFAGENMGRIIREFIKIRMQDNDNFKLIENPSGHIYMQLCNYSILCTHGEEKNMKQAIDSFSRTYGVPLDYMISAHMHHSKRETIGVNNEIISVGSIIGMDDYSLKLGKSANPEASLFVFESLKGKVCEYTIKFLH